MKIKIWFLFILLSTSVKANDGAYYASGNQLIPITETEICITKEILTVVKKTVNGTEYVYVTVDYTFFNPSKEKEILVGFEAPSPSGDVDGSPKNGAHPYISNFDVNMNGKELSFKTSIVNTDNYYINNRIDAKTEEQVIGSGFNANEVEFYYVYHFKANFKPGGNKIKHTYRFDMSGSVVSDYDFDYILTAANRWENNQIDDFTLHIDMGDNEHFNIRNSFFNDKKEWIIDDGRSLDNINEYSKEKESKFITYNGGITFKQKNFTPEGELYLNSPRTYMYENYETFDSSQHILPKTISFNGHYLEDVKLTATHSVDENSFKILRNLPFAVRGYIFKTELIQKYYLNQNWYRPNPKYTADIKALSTEEKDWLNAVKTNEWYK